MIRIITVINAIGTTVCPNRNIQPDSAGLHIRNIINLYQILIKVVIPIHVFSLVAEEVVLVVYEEVPRIIVKIAGIIAR